MLEIERKWRLEKVPQRIIDSGTPTRILQGYLLVNDRGEVRLRKEADTFILTFKSNGTLARSEENYTLESALGFSLLWPNILDELTEKIRYRYTTEAGTFELDVFDGYHKGLITLELEFPDIATALAFVLPEWAEGAVEVTKDPRYKNKNLALKATTIRHELKF